MPWAWAEMILGYGGGVTWLWVFGQFCLTNLITAFMNISWSGLRVPYLRQYLGNRNTPQKWDRFRRASCWWGCRIASSRSIGAWQLFYTEMQNVWMQHKRSNEPSLLLRRNILNKGSPKTGRHMKACWKSFTIHQRHWLRSKDFWDQQGPQGNRKITSKWLLFCLGLLAIYTLLEYQFACRACAPCLTGMVS